MTNRESSTLKPLPLKVIDRLFLQMAAIYAKRWLDHWGDIPMGPTKEKWARSLAKFTLHEIADAIEYCANNADKIGNRVPDLGDFVAICKSVRKVEVAKALPRNFTPEEIERNHERMQAEADKLQQALRRDYRGWARNILRRVAEGDKTVRDVAVEYAKQALAGVA